MVGNFLGEDVWIKARGGLSQGGVWKPGVEDCAIGRDGLEAVSVGGGACGTHSLQASALGAPTTLEGVSASPQLLDVSVGPVELALEMIRIDSVSGNEQHLADRVEATLAQAAHLECVRHGNTVAARTNLGRDTRVIVAGHLDTVPLTGAPEPGIAHGVLSGRGSVDMKAGLASQLIHAVTLEAPAVDVTWMFYDQEEVEASRNGLGHFATAHPDWMSADAAVLGEPSQGGVEGGCNGTMRIEIHTHGVAAHSARPWRGDNAIHHLAPVLATLAGFEPETRVVEGLAYRESLNAVGVSGGVAGNVIPDHAVLTVNFRFAPDRSEQDAEGYLREVFAGEEIVVVDSSPGARPGLDVPIMQALVEATGREVGPKYGWTDVARFSALGIPAVNFGPGDGGLAHSDSESVEVSEIEHCHRVLGAWLA